MQIRRGERIAIIGSSGSGKSTLLGLMRWLYPADRVACRIDQSHTQTFDQLAAITSLIPQDPEIFENTIRYNITMDIECPDERLKAYIHQSCFDDILVQLPHWLDTDIKEKWVNLSWWQKQRLALARWLFLSEESSVLLLDEPTSSVDSITEQHIYQRIFTAYPQKTCIANVHRLHMLHLFDTVYHLKDGNIIESGSRDVLRTAWWPTQALWNAYLAVE